MAPTCCGRWSTDAESCSPSREDSVQEPAGRRRFALIEPGAVEPEAPSRLVLDTIIVAQLLGFLLASPPLAADALRPVGAADAMLDAAPVEDQRRISGHQRHGHDRLGPRQEADRPPPLGVPAAGQGRQD